MPGEPIGEEQSTMIEWLLRKIGALHSDQRLVRVKSWLPSTDSYSICWPTMLVRCRGGGRETVQPIWFLKEK